MAIGTPTQRYAQQLTAQGATSAFSPASTIAAGTVAIIATACLANKAISSVTDSAGNTWVVDVTANDGTRADSFASAQIATQITTGGTITITWSSATSNATIIWVQEVTGLATSSVFDKSASGTGTGTSPATSATATLSQADEIAFGVFRTSADCTWTKGASFSNPTTPAIPTGAGAARAALEYQIVAATTGLAADGTFSPSVTWVGLIATYKAPASGTTFTKDGTITTGA